MKNPAKKNMYKGVSAAYTIIVLSYWQLAFFGYWAFGSNVQPYIVASLTTPMWTIIMANLFAVIQISGCFQVIMSNSYFVVPLSVHFYSWENLKIFTRLHDGFFLQLWLLIFVDACKVVANGHIAIVSVEQFWK